MFRRLLVFWEGQALKGTKLCFERSCGVSGKLIVSEFSFPDCPQNMVSLSKMSIIQEMYLRSRSYFNRISGFPRRTIQGMKSVYCAHYRLLLVSGYCKAAAVAVRPSGQFSSWRHRLRWKGRRRRRRRRESPIPQRVCSGLQLQAVTSATPISASMSPT